MAGHHAKLSSHSRNIHPEYRRNDKGMTNRLHAMNKPTRKPRLKHRFIRKSRQPRIQQPCPRRLKMPDIARHHGHVVNQRCCRDISDANRNRIGYMQPCSFNRYPAVENQDALLKDGKNFLIHPQAQRRTLPRVSALHSQDTNLQLFQRHNGKIDIFHRHPCDPSRKACATRIPW
jgi:hypothetical protein